MLQSASRGGAQRPGGEVPPPSRVRDGGAHAPRLVSPRGELRSMSGPHLPTPPAGADAPGGRASWRRHLGPATPGRRLATLAGLAVLACWAVLWVQSYLGNRLEQGPSLWVPEMPFLAGDFVV